MCDLTETEIAEARLALLNRFHYNTSGGTTNPVAKSAFDKLSRHEKNRGKVFIRMPDETFEWTAWGDVVSGIPYQYISDGVIVRVELE